MLDHEVHLSADLDRYFLAPELVSQYIGPELESYIQREIKKYITVRIRIAIDSEVGTCCTKKIHPDTYNWIYSITNCNSDGFFLNDQIN